MTLNNLIIAIDAGGTKCHAILYDTAQQKTLAQAKTGSANLASDYSLALCHIQQACTDLLKQVGLADSNLAKLAVYAGLAGVNFPQIANKLAKWQHPFKSFGFTTDLHLACYGAHQNSQGNVIIVGTGSCGIAISKTKSVVLGGYGHKLGDQASGAWIGQQAVQVSLLTLDGLLKPNALTQAICNTSQISTPAELSQYWHNATPAQFSALADIVFSCAQQQDEQATLIIKQAAQYIEQLFSQLLKTQTGPSCMVGGISKRIAPWLNQSVKAQLSEAKAEPVYGALSLYQNPDLCLNLI